jgi:hypothetical protein
MNFDPTKPVQTRDGRKAEVLRHDLISDRPIIAVVTEANGRQFVYSYLSSGRLSSWEEGRLDLINIPPTPEKRVGWMNVYPLSHDSEVVHRSKESADRNCSNRRIACVRIEYEFTPEARP